MSQKLVWGPTLGGVLFIATLLTSCAEMAEMKETGTPSAPSAAPVTGPGRVAAGTQGDSLEACLSRIPSDASAGQRMLAERTCRRDAMNRQPIEAVPGK